MFLCEPLHGVYTAGEHWHADWTLCLVFFTLSVHKSRFGQGSGIGWNANGWPSTTQRDIQSLYHPQMQQEWSALSISSYKYVLVSESYVNWVALSSSGLYLVFSREKGWEGKKGANNTLENKEANSSTIMGSIWQTWSHAPEACESEKGSALASQYCYNIYTHSILS